jgi:SAM-dependent methyltransferase
LKAAERSGFAIRVPFDERHPPRDALLEVTPWIGTRRGRRLYGVVEPALPTPSAEYVELVGGGFNLGFETLGFLIELAGLRPGERVLDIGCGTGRVAYALAHYLAPEARYEGFDVLERLVTWCRETIAPRHPRFGFTRVDVRNTFYNPAGTIEARDLAFPYPTGSFDVAFAASVFTHLLADEVTHYLDETRRVLRPGGRFLSSWFLFDDEAWRLHERGASGLRFAHRVGDAFASDRDVPEAVTAFDERRVQRWLAERGFVVEGTLRGSWSGRARYGTFQDFLVLRRR